MCPAMGPGGVASGSPAGGVPSWALFPALSAHCGCFRESDLVALAPSSRRQLWVPLGCVGRQADLSRETWWEVPVPGCTSPPRPVSTCCTAGVTPSELATGTAGLSRPGTVRCVTGSKTRSGPANQAAHLGLPHCVRRPGRHPPLPAAAAATQASINHQHVSHCVTARLPPAGSPFPRPPAGKRRSQSLG